MRFSLFVTVLFALGAGTAYAQVPGRQGPPGGPPPGGEVRGSVTDEAGAGIAGATVAVWSKADSSLVAGAVVREDGAFRVAGLRPGPYRLRVTSLGYVSKNQDFALAAGSPVADVGPIRLATNPVEQEEIAVTVERPTVSIEPDRNAYRAKDIAPAATSASDVLEATPSVQVDTDGKVSLRGNENVAVQINGRPAPVSGDQLGNYLRQLPANMVDRVEVIPTPSARYDPEGMAGIINIVMKQNTDLGTSGGFTVGAASSERYNVGGTLGYQRGRATSFTSYGYNHDSRDYLGINDRDRLDALGAILSSTNQDLTGDAGRGGHNLSTTLDWKLTDRSVLTNALVLNRRSSREDTFSAWTELDDSGAVVDEYARPRNQDSESNLIDYTVAWKRTVEPRANELSAEVRFNRSHDDDTALLWRQPQDDAAARTEIERDVTDGLTRELTGQLDWVRTIGGIKLESGYKGSGRRLDRDFTVLEDELGTGTYTPSDLSNAFEFDENVQAVYAVLSRQLGKVQLQGGLRGEYASQDFTLADQSYPHDYTSLFPSAVALWDANERDQLKISYSRRIRRPGAQELNPFPTFFDSQNVFIGNPELDPEYTDALELGYTRQMELGSLQISPFWRHTTDIIRFVVDTDDVVNGREVTSVSFENLATSDSYGADLKGSLKLGNWLNGFASFNVFKQVTDGGSVTSLASNAVTWSARVNGTVELNPTLSVQAMAFYRAPMEFETGKFSSFKMTSLTVRQKLMDEQASLSVRVFDPFRLMGFRVETGDENLFQITERDFDARQVYVTFQYNFGRPPRVRQPRPDAGGDQGGGVFPQ